VVVFFIFVVATSAGTDPIGTRRCSRLPEGGPLLLDGGEPLALLAPGDGSRHRIFYLLDRGRFFGRERLGRAAPAIHACAAFAASVGSPLPSSMTLRGIGHPWPRGAFVDRGLGALVRGKGNFLLLAW